MANVIIGIHGLSNKPPKELLADWWERAIREGLQKNAGVANANFDFVMIYWADLLHIHPQHENHDFKFDTLYDSQPYYPVEDNSLLKRYEDGLMDEFRFRVTEPAGSLVRRALESVGLESAMDFLLAKKFRDLHFYYDEAREIKARDGGAGLARRALMDELTNELRLHRNDRLMLIAHSMGSIIAYDALRDLGKQMPDFRVEHFVTIGSPLGVRLVKENIFNEHPPTESDPMPLRTPTVVRERWVNYADRKDRVALDPHLSDDFGPNSSNVKVEDDLVFNNYMNPFSKEERNFHKSYGYLRTPELSEHIRDFLRG